MGRKPKPPISKTSQKPLLKNPPSLPDGSGSEGGFAESESPVVLASGMMATFSTVTSVDGASSKIDRGAVETADALESLRRLLETILVISARWSSDVGG